MKHRSPSLAHQVLRGIHRLLRVVKDMERRGVSQRVWEGELGGRLSDGRPVRMRYRYGIRLGLDGVVPEHRAQRKVISRKAAS